MKADTTITITPALIEDWEKQALDREGQATKLLEEAKAYRTRADAGRLLLGLSGEVAKPVATAGQEAEPGESMMEAMARIANGADKPMTKATMKSRLMMLGFPEDRMASYFYTCVMRLKTKRRITVTEDGRMWKGETP